MNPSEIGGILLLGVLAALLLKLGWKKRVFFLKEQRLEWALPLRWYHVVVAFALYFSVILFATPLFAAFLRSFLVPGGNFFLAFASWIHFLTSLAILSLLALYCSQLPNKITTALWQRERFSFRKEILAALLFWLLSFPLVLFINQFFDLIVSFLFHIQELPEQLAVHFLKLTFGHPFYFSLATATIVLFAPFIEEALFRGFLQSFIRQHLGSKQAIAITAVSFSLFHYAPEQGFGNIPIIASLFVLALFLGVLYEKRGALAAPIALHASFNAVSVFNLYFFG